MAFAFEHPLCKTAIGQQSNYYLNWKHCAGEWLNWNVKTRFGRQSPMGEAQRRSIDFYSITLRIPSIW